MLDESNDMHGNISCQDELRRLGIAPVTIVQFSE